MRAVAQPPEVARPAARTRWDVAEACLAVAAFAVLCVLVLRATPYLPRRQPFIAITTLVVVAALFGLGGWAFHDMYKFPFGPQFAVVPGPGGTVELEPGPGAIIGGP